MIRGIFVAQKPPFFNCTGPFKGKFPAQVKVKWYHQFQPVPCNIFDFGRMFSGNGNRERKLSKNQTHGIISSFVNYFWRRDVWTEPTAMSVPITIPTHASEEQTNSMKKTSTSKSHVKGEMHSRLDYCTTPNVLLYNGQLIPVYNPRRVSPEYLALPTVQQHDELGIQISSHCIPLSKMSPCKGLQTVPLQVDLRTVVGKIPPIFSVNRHNVIKNDEKNALLHSN